MDDDVPPAAAADGPSHAEPLSGLPTDERVAAPFAIAPSGGGNRSAVLAIGALLAIVDRGLNTSTVVISSVSGRLGHQRRRRSAHRRPDFLTGRNVSVQLRKRDAYALLRRGYANTWLTSLLLHPLAAAADTHAAADVIERLEQISGPAGSISVVRSRGGHVG